VDENELKEGLRGLTLVEPELGFNPDDLADRGAKRRKNRRMTVAAGTGTFAVAAAVVTFLVVANDPGERLPLSPAAGAGDTTTNPPTITYYESAPTKPMDPAHDLTAQIARNKNHLQDVMPALKPDGRQMSIPIAVQDYAAEKDAWDALTLSMEFVDPAGPGAFNLTITGKNSTQMLVNTCVTEGSEANCQHFPQPDGSVVDIVDSKTDGPGGPIPGSRNATHRRKDGTAVSTFNDTLISASMAKRFDWHGSTFRTQYPLNDQQLIALVTDPAFNVG
jgi:hypothetical protein